MKRPAKGTALRTKYCPTGAEAARANKVPGFSNVRLDGSPRTSRRSTLKALLTKDGKRQAAVSAYLATVKA